MRMNRAWLSLFVFGCLVCTAAVADETQLQVFDPNGVQLVEYGGLLVSPNGDTTKLQPRADGTWTIDVTPGQKLSLRLYEADGPQALTVDFKIGAEVQALTAVQVPAEHIPPQTPANDTCDGRDPIEANGMPVAGDTSLASFTGAYPTCDGVTHTAPELWYGLMGDGTTYTASLCNTASYDTKLSVYCLDCTPNAATCVAGNDDNFGAGCGLTSQLSFCSGAGNEYFVMVHGFSAAVGAFELTVTSDGVPCTGAVDCTPPDPTGACCFCDCFDPPRAECLVLTEAACGDGGGTYAGNDAPCFLESGVDSIYTSMPNLAVPDGGDRVTDEIVIPDLESCLVADIDVRLEVTGTWIGDLVIDVNSPAFTQVLVWSRNCGSFDNIMSTVDDDGSATLCVDISGGPSTDVFFDSGILGDDFDLANFEGEQSGGTWVIGIQDFVGADAHTLDLWELIIDCGTATCPDTDCVAGPGPDDEVDDDSSSDSDGSDDVADFFVVPESGNNPTQLAPRAAGSEADNGRRGTRGRQIR